jgi:hypothetical protein
VFVRRQDDDEREGDDEQEKQSTDKPSPTPVKPPRYESGKRWLNGIILKWFRVSAEHCDMINLPGIVLYKVGNILFFLVPYIALGIWDCKVSRNGWIASSGPALLISFSEGLSIASPKRVFGKLAWFRRSCGSRLRDRRYDDSPQLFESHLARILVSF